MKQVFYVLSIIPTLSLAQTADVKLKDIPTNNEETSIVIKKGKQAIDEKKYELLSEEEEISGEPTMGRKNAYASWKAACAEWKKEKKQQSADNQVLSVNCSTPTFTQENSMYTYKSKGSYKMKVLIKSSQEK